MQVEKWVGRKFFWYKMIRTAEFVSCTVTVHDGWIETIFREDGSVSCFHPPVEDQGFRDAARYVGYGDDAWRHGVEHDLTHAWLADRMGWPHSWSVWSAAHGTGDPGPAVVEVGSG